MTCASEPQRRIACVAVHVTKDGRHDTARFAARYDGRRYAVTGLRAINFVTLQREAAAVIVVFGKGMRPAIAYRMVRSADGRHLTARSIDPGTRQTLFSIVRYDLIP